MGNYLKTIVLLGVLSVILIVIGGYIGGTQGIYYAFFFSLLLNFGTYFFSDKIALAANHAQPLSQEQAPDLYSMIADLSQRYNIPMPKLYVTPDTQANAFATGRDPRHSSVAVTQGLLQILPSDEVRAVLAHELGHVKNRDVLLTTIAAVLASAVSFIANMGFYIEGDRDRQNALLGLLAIILLPIAATLLQLAISRQREFGADEAGAHIIGSGKPLAEALIAIDQTTRNAPMNMNPAFSSLYIANPFHAKGLQALFSTHPSTEERVKRLMKI